jgi:L-lactate permease
MNGHDFAGSILLGLAAMVGFVLLVLAGMCWNRAMEWVDDFETHRVFNPVITPIMLMLGYTKRVPDQHGCSPQQWNWKYAKARGQSTGDVAVAVGVMGSFLAMPLGYVSYYNPALPIVLGAVLALAVLARFVKRLKKKFDLHVATRDAHK